MGLLEELARRIRVATGSAADWPPPAVREAWQQVEYYRVRFRNDPGLLLPYNTAYSSASFERQSQYTPVPLARELARYSAALLFSAPAKLTLKEDEGEDGAAPNPLQDEMDELLLENGAEAFFQEAAETVAVEGRGAFRVIRDDSVSGWPLLTYVNEDQIIWDVRHGRFVRGGVVVIEAKSESGLDVYRLLESHEPGLVTRELYRGSESRLGSAVDVASDSVPEAVRGFEEREETGLDVPTLIRWDNVPGGRSDLFAVEILLDRLDEAESLLVEKGRKSRPWIFAARSLADGQGRVDISNLIFLERSEAAEYLDERQTGAPVVHVQPDMQTSEHVAWIEHIRESALTLSGYSQASWGLEAGGSADSGKALKLRQARTLLTKAAKERMAREAISTAVGVALALKIGAQSPQGLKPDVKFGDGLPRDEGEIAQTVATMRGAEAMSVEEAVRLFRPDLDDAAVEEEVGRIEGAAKPESPLDSILGGRSARPNPLAALAPNGRPDEEPR